MKTRLIIASLSTFVIAFLLAVTIRTSAVAQQQSPPPPPDERPQVLPEGTSAGSGAETYSPDHPKPASEGNAGDLAAGDPPVPAGELDTETGELTFDFTIADAEEDMVIRGEAKETLSVDFPDEEIRSVLRIVADLFDLNLVVPEGLVGRASIKLRDVTWRQVFDVVLSPVGFTYVEDGNIIKVVSLESLTLEPPLTVVVILDYAQADGIVESIRPLVNAAMGGRVQVDKRSNALVITERPTQLRRIEGIIASLDHPNVQVMIESKFIETRNRAIENIGVNWASLDGYGVRAGSMQHEFLRERNVGSPGTTDGAIADTSRITTAVFSADQFEVILSAIRTTNDVKVVSNPTVVTLNNKAARIHIGEEFPIVLPRFNPQTGTYEAGEYDTIDIGIKLDVTPQVNNAGFINLDVEPDVSTLAGTITYFGAQYPIRATRNAKSNVTVKDGYTLAIGGLVQDDTINVETRVPVLGSIPGLGKLFRSNNKDNDQRNLIIFLTARTLSPDGSTVEETVDPRTIHNMGLTREEMPGYRPDIPMWPTPPETKDDKNVKVEVIGGESASEEESALEEEFLEVSNQGLVDDEGVTDTDVSDESSISADEGEVSAIDEMEVDAVVSEPVESTSSVGTRRSSGFITP